jgi:predicted ATPase
MNAQMRSETTQVALISLLRSLAKPGSVIILDNAHWLDSASWALLAAVRQQLSGILIVLSMRKLNEKYPFELSQMTHSRHTKIIQLNNLSESSTALLVKQTLGGAIIPMDLAKEVYKKSQGNPFLTEKIVTAFRDTGALKIKENRVECIQL